MKFWSDEEEVTILDGEVRDHSESSFLRYIKIRGIYFWSRACKVIEQFKSMRFKRNYFISVWSIMQELCCFCGYDRALCCWKIKCIFSSKQSCPSWNNILWKQKFKNAWKIIYSLPYLKTELVWKSGKAIYSVARASTKLVSPALLSRQQRSFWTSRPGAGFSRTALMW